MKEHYISPFETDAEAAQTLAEMLSDGKYRGCWYEGQSANPSIPHWQTGVANDSAVHTVTLSGDFSVAELMALIHFHPELMKRRAEGTSEPKSDEVRILELALQKVSATLNEVLEVCDPAKESAGVVERQYAQIKRIFMRARASLPPGYSMSLVKKGDNNAV